VSRSGLLNGSRLGLVSRSGLLNEIQLRFGVPEWLAEWKQAKIGVPEWLALNEKQLLSCCFGLVWIISNVITNVINFIT